MITRQTVPFIAILMVVVVALACSQPSAPVTPTHNPITETFIAEMQGALFGGLTQTAHAQFFPETSTLAPPLELTRLAEAQTAFPDEAILILAPGPGSQITSPVSIAGISNPTFENNLVVEIQDERSNVLGSATTTINADLGQRGPFELSLEFSPPASPKAGRITVADYSARDGHLVHFSTVPVTLLPSGAVADLQPGSEHAEEIAILSPALSDVVSGGVVQVSGVAAPIFEQSLSLAVLDANGVIVGIGSATIQAGAGQPGRFGGEAQYSVSSEQPGAIQVSAVSARDGGLIHLSSVEVTLRP